MNILNIAKGKLTKTTALILIVWAIVGFIIGQLEAVVAGELILIGLGFFGLRRAIQ